MQLPCCLRDHATLITRPRKLVCAWLPGAIAARDRGGAVGRASCDLVELHLASEAIVQADHGHAEMQQVGDDRKQRRLLTAMLGCGSGEGAADLAVKGTFRPQPTGLIEKFAICEDMRPKRVPVPTMMAS